jgi:serine/threonine protein kinase
LLTTRILTQLGVQTSSELNVLLCDFGQSRLATEVSLASFSNQRAATRYLAPELSAKGAVHSKLTDVFAAGAFMFDVLSLVARGMEANDPVLVPRKLWELCKRCTSQDPGKRPEALTAVFELERLKDEEYREKQNFELINLREALYEPSLSSTHGSLVGSVEDIDSLLSRQSIQDSLDRFL